MEKAEYEDSAQRDCAEHLRNILLAIRNVHQLIVRETDPKELVKKVCSELTNTRGYFNAWIAMMDEKGDVVEVIETPMPDKEHKHCKTRKKDILLVDDEPAILRMLVLICTRSGYQVDTAQSGETAVKKLESGEYRLVVTDIKMPGVSGNEVLEYVKSRKGSTTPVLGMSGTPWLLDGGFDAVLQKPCTRAEILDVIGRLMKQTEKNR